MSKENKNKGINLIYLIVFLLIGIIIYCYFVIYGWKKSHYYNYAKIINEIEIDSTVLEDEEDNQSQEIALNSIRDSNNEKSDRTLKVKTLKKNYNNDIVGWIEISGTRINYPVLQGEDNEYYLTHTYLGEKSVDGSIFLDKDFRWKTLSSNLLIYGHNNLNGRMFQDLLKYEKQSYYKQHPTVRFTTTNDDYNYDIISVFKSTVYSANDKNVFKYYNFINTSSIDEYNTYVAECKKASIYDTGHKAKFGDQLLTLSTCDYSREDGRFVVVAKKSTKL